ncbi:MAG: hypothetical protein ABIO86_04770 [Sphingomonas sp.]
MARFSSARHGLLWPAVAIGMVCLFAASILLQTPMTDSERATWASRFADRHAYSDARLREMVSASDPEMAAILKAELAKRGARAE